MTLSATSLTSTRLPQPWVPASDCTSTKPHTAEASAKCRDVVGLEQHSRGESLAELKAFPTNVPIRLLAASRMWLRRHPILRSVGSAEHNTKMTIGCDATLAG
jgi:hypothetical protein